MYERPARQNRACNFPFGARGERDGASQTSGDDHAGEQSFGLLRFSEPVPRYCCCKFHRIPRSLAASISPAISGALLATSFAVMPLVISGVRKSIYDLTLLFSFRHINKARA